MIVKKVPNPKKSASKPTRINMLTNYITAPEKTNAQEKAIYVNARGFITDDLRSQQAEMIALSQEAVRSKDTINHYVLSWREGEQPTPKQIENAVDIFLDEMNLTDHQTIYGLHADTDNMHLHIVVNRVHPETLQVIKINKGFDIEAAHKAVAKIEHAQGWSREANGRYQVLESGDIARGHNDTAKPRQPSQQRRDMENKTGEKSAERIAIEQAAPIIKAAKTWAQLHTDLAAAGIRYERTGSGATIFINEQGVKASSADRKAALTQLTKRLGPFEPSTQKAPNEYRTHQPTEPHFSKPRNLTDNRMHNLSQRRLAHSTEGASVAGILQINAQPHRRRFERVRREPGTIEKAGTRLNQVNDIKPQPIKQNAPDWKNYIELKNDHYALKEAIRLEVGKRHDEQRKELSQKQKAHRTDVLQGDWKGRGELRNAMQSILAAEQAGERAEMQERHKRDREKVRQHIRPYPSFEDWRRQNKTPELAEQWRHRESETQRIEGDSIEPVTVRDIRAYTPEIHGQEVHYFSKHSDRLDDVPAFVDKGKTIDIEDWKNRDSTLAALQLAAQKWATFEVIGSDEYKKQAVKLAAEHGFKINNPELQQAIQEERQRQQAERTQAMKSPQLQQFELYAAAVDAARYRVTSIKMRADGTQQVFILDKKDGITKGFTQDEITRKTPEMQKLQRRGENLYYTPLSDGKHHILIDDLNKEKLAKLIEDGHKPAVVLESSPGNYQAIITIPKLGTPHDKDVGNRLTEQLNKLYGDAKLSGAIHPHRAPGYENRKPKHQREDGTYPEVKLLKAERRESAQTLALSVKINAEYERQAMLKTIKAPTQATKAPTQAPSANPAQGGALVAYQAHYKDIVARQKGGNVDLSRVDSMIAVRMRVTGHTQADIAGVIGQAAPTTRPADSVRNWTDYADRTARYAFSPAGDRQAEQLSKYGQQWATLEGRDAQQIEQQQAERQADKDIDKDHGMSI